MRCARPAPRALRSNTDYVDVVADRGYEQPVIAAVADYVREVSDRWDECDLRPLASTSPLRSLARSRAWPVTESRDGVYPVVVLRAPGAPIEDVVPGRFLAKLRATRQRVARRNGVRVLHAGAAEAMGGFEALCALHDARWRSRGEQGVLADRATRRFHREVVRGMGAARMLRLHVLHIADRPAAAVYGFARGRARYLYLSGFDPAFERDSAGSLAILEAIELARDHGQTRFDFLRGGEPYKYRWGAIDESGYRVAIANRARSAASRHIA